MATWTTPRTWANQEIVSDSEMNSNVRDNLNFLYAPPAWTQRTTDYTLVTGTNETPALLTLAIPDSGYVWEAEAFIPATYSSVSGDRGQYKLYLPDGTTQCGGVYVNCSGAAGAGVVVKGRVPSGQSGNITMTLFRAGGTGNITARFAEGGFLKLTRMS